MSGGRDYDSHKLQELVLFVARRCEADATFDSVKLNQILFFSDFDAFANLGRSITGARYQHLPEGPALGAVPPLLRDMSANALIWEISGTEGPRHRRAVALRDPDLSVFSAEEIAIATEYIVKFWGLPARDVSDYSHETVAWRITRDRQEIPYGAAFLSAEEPTDEEIEWAREVAASHGLLAAP